MHDAYRRTLDATGTTSAQDALASMASELFGGDTPAAKEDSSDSFRLSHATQGLDAVGLVEQSLREGDPYRVAFIDIRMPPGIDGKETAKRIRALDPEINLVIVTGYSDYSPIEISRAAGPIDKIFYITKPFEVNEVSQTARALCQRWQVDSDLAHARNALAEKVSKLEEKTLALAANEARAVHMASHDSLTGAPNRLAFLRELSERTQADRSGFAVGMLDLDRFKNVNDTLGHAAGDELIREVCKRLSAELGDGMVARLGGDEFGLLFDATDARAAMEQCERIVAVCSTTYIILGHSVQVSASMGLILATPSSEDDKIDHMRLADLALYEAKRAGRSQVRLFDASMDESVRFRQSIEAGLRQAIARRELEVVYQPIVARERLDIVGFEALLRWTSDEHGSISPSVFIPIAEESNLIHELGDWVTAEALAECQRWPHQYVSINFSPRQFRRQDFVESLAATVAKSGLPPQRVQIEITETAIFDDDLRAAETLQRLRGLGFRIALDDFGTGYSSLFNIRNFALDCLKIDKSFIDGLGREVESAAIVNSVTHLARSLGLGVVAEGVETETQNQALRLAGCSHLQGYYYGRPGNAALTASLAAQGTADDRPSVAAGVYRLP
ncbi:two-component system response regulator [Sphingomonas sp. KC8]|uniref:two-component system response regulator n=1 Tax=Sphingomonas sp. KC8 TaxID=1030157 RepID=UPI0002489F6E|nr:EAL domain-containing protein [Sphingomonas sp. KC8]ARS28056.1 diguanylate cyclase [Sphingomonas sp. KC8]